MGKASETCYAPVHALLAELASHQRNNDATKLAAVKALIAALNYTAS